MYFTYANKSESHNHSTKKIDRLLGFDHMANGKLTAVVKLSAGLGSRG